MRTARSLALSLLVLPTLVPAVASAQVYVPAPPPAPGVRVHGGIWIQWGRHRPTPPAPVYVPAPPVYVPPPPQVYVTPPPPPVYAPPPPVYFAPPPPPVYSPPVSVMTKPVVKPQWNARLGLGATFEGTFGTKESASRGYGILGQLRYRTGRHLALELQGGWERSTTNSGATRTDVPFTFGLLVPFLGPEHAFSPYFVAAGGVNFADLNLVDSDAFKLDDKRAQLLGQLGGGVELRLGHRFAINADLRVEGRWNMHGPSDDVAQSTVKIDGNQILPLANSVGVRLGAGATVYF